MLSNDKIKDICEAILDGTYSVGELLDARHTILGIVEVINGNPNGDPATGSDNIPRTDIIDGHGIISNVCLKRKMRDTVVSRHENEYGYELYCERGSNVQNLQEAIRAQVYGVFEQICKDRGVTAEADIKASWLENQRAILLAVVSEAFVDVRMFGCVLTSLVRNVENKNVPVQVKGPIQVCDAKSFDVVAIDQRTIAPTFGNKDDNDRNFGSKAVIPYGLYVFHADVSPLVARNTKMTKNDMAAFLDALKWMFELDNSASRGEQNLIALWDFEHGGDEALYGAQPRRELYSAVKVTKLCKDIPSSLDDYRIEFDDSVICDDVHVTRLV